MPGEDGADAKAEARAEGEGAAHGAAAELAAALLAIAPEALGGALLRARFGPAREAWLARVAALAPGRAMARIPPGAPEERLSGGLDLAATLSAGRPVRREGLLTDGIARTLVLPMAERLTGAEAARLGAALDAGGAGVAVIALDEGAEADERAPAALADRLALHIAPPERGAGAPPPTGAEIADVELGRALFPHVTVPEDAMEALAGAAAMLGIASMRAPLLAAAAARAAAAFAGRSEVSSEDAAIAARFVLAPRAVTAPPDEEEEAPDEETPPPPETPPDAPEAPEREDQDARERPMEDVVLEAARAALDAGLLARLAAAGSLRRAETSGGAGGAAPDATRGRPAGARRGQLRGGARIDLVETLRAAAPWQPLRRAEAVAAGAADPADPADPAARARVHVRADDIRIRRYRKSATRTLIFAVDASGSSAIGRLAEAKGAVELLLADAYATRDEAALIAFRGAGAELLLPPTRSLARARRLLAGAPGGGGTPLAAGLRLVLELALQRRRAGAEPALILLTDGRANVALDGAGGRARAGEEATSAARALRAAAVPALVLDISPRPRGDAAALAAEMGARCVALPRADARGLAGAVRAAGGAGR